MRHGFCAISPVLNGTLVNLLKLKCEIGIKHETKRKRALSMPLIDNNKRFPFTNPLIFNFFFKKMQQNVAEIPLGPGRMIYCMFLFIFSTL